MTAAPAGNRVFLRSGLSCRGRQTCSTARPKAMRTSANRNSTVSEVRWRGPLGTMPATSACGKLRERPRSESGRSHGGCYGATALAELAPCVVRRDDVRPDRHDSFRQQCTDRAAGPVDQGRPRAHRHAGQPHRRIRRCRLQRDCEPADLASRRPDESPADHRRRPAGRASAARSRALRTASGSSLRRACSPASAARATDRRPTRSSRTTSRRPSCRRRSPS